jgi:hypothetical protein
VWFMPSTLSKGNVVNITTGCLILSEVRLILLFLCVPRMVNHDFTLLHCSYHFGCTQLNIIVLKQ